MIMTNRIVFLSIVVAFAAIGCDNSDSTSSAPPTKTAATEAKEETTTQLPVDSVASSERQAFDGLKFQVPDDWKQVELSQFQMGIISAKFEIPSAGPDVTLTLSRSGGGIEANLDRWRGQVEQSRPEATETISVAGIDATLVDLEGRFSAGFGRDPQDGWRMLGIVVPLADQGYFMKLTGPAGDVETVKEQFKAFAKSAVKE